MTNPRRRATPFPGLSQMSSIFERLLSRIETMTGIARENVSRVFNEWKRHKLVSRLSGYYCLENKARLKAEA